jgi:hypothetical protein
MLPDGLFVNLIDLDLQEQIANCNDLDKDTMEALKIILDKGPMTVINELDDWTMEIIHDKKILFYKGKNYIPKDIEL